MTTAKHVLRYLKRTINYDVIFRKSDADLNWIGFVMLTGQIQKIVVVLGYWMCFHASR